MPKSSFPGDDQIPMIIAITPFEQPDVKLASALADSEALPVIDLGHDGSMAKRALSSLATRGFSFGIRLSEPYALEPFDLPDGVSLVVLAAPDRNLIASFQHASILVQVCSREQAFQAKQAGADGLIAKGGEACGRVGEQSAFVLAQQLLACDFGLPLWVQGGIGPNTAAACIAGGSNGVVLDSGLACMPESSIPAPIKNRIAKLDGTKTECLVDQKSKASWTVDGQDASLAGPLAAQFADTQALVHAIRKAIGYNIRQARTLKSLAPRSPLARAHGLIYPVVQGPMSRVSDRASFSRAVSDAGGLPLLGLSLLRGDALTNLLQETAALLGDQPWGVGILGFAPDALRKEQQRAIEAVKPPVVLIAGGRPSQARPYESMGIPTYLHVPSTGLLEMFLADDARRFILEGRECGGHVGPKTSFVLWEQQVDKLLSFDAPEELSILFAGGIHDARSAAMVAALAAPLAVRGAKIGILMGTAYLFTQEAVQTGAILKGFQEAVLSCNRTVLLETAPGHASRCVETEYALSFKERRQALEAEGKSSEEVWTVLEEMNLGRLRIAAKGVKHSAGGDSGLIRVNLDGQRREGMYMAGQVAALRRDVCTMETLHRDVTEGAVEHLDKLEQFAHRERSPRPVDVAIVGMSCIFPDAPDLASYWTNILTGYDAIKEVDPERWDPALYFDAKATDGEAGKKTYSKWGGFIPKVDFDPIAWGMPPNALAAIEPVQLLSLEVARRALHDAGYGDDGFDRTQTSVIFGAEAGTDLSGAYGFRALLPKYFGEIPEELDRVLPSLTGDSFPGVLANVIAGRIANRLDLGGVNYTVDAACGSSLAAVHAACQELVSYSSDMVVCGGADLHNGINDYLMFSSTHALSAKGISKPFDADSDGIILGEGIACVILKRLEDAKRDGDRIYSVIRGIAGTGDGRSEGLTVPKKDGQVRVLQRAYAQAGIQPSQVELMEAHGTGTVLGDRTELSTLNDVYQADGASPNSCVLGSVKSQIGHTKCAAGLAGIIKVALSLYHHTQPQTLHVRKPNPGYQPGVSPFAFISSARPWAGSNRKAAVSAFGFGGTNFHAVLEEPESQRPPLRSMEHWPAELLLFRGADKNEALETVRQVQQLLANDPPIQLRDLAHSVGSSKNGPVQLAVVAKDLADLSDQLNESSMPRVFVPGESAGTAEAPPNLDRISGKIAFMFPGQGSQRPGMLADLFVAFPEIHKWLEMGSQYVPHLFPIHAFSLEEDKAFKEKLADTRIAQPALGMVNMAIAQLLSEFGVRPDMLAGHSYGELTALCFAGALRQADLLEISHARAQAIFDAAGDTQGTMAAVIAPADAVEEAIRDVKGVVIANYNQPNQTVISGSVEGVTTAEQSIEARGMKCHRIPVSCAFHSPLVARASDTFAKTLSTFNIQQPKLPVWSNTTAERYPQDPEAIRCRLAEHLVEPVQFTQQVESMYADGARLFIEVGPGRVLTGLVGKILKGRPHKTIACDQSGQSGMVTLLKALARMAIHRVPIDVDALFIGRHTRPFDLDNAPVRSRASWQIDGGQALPRQGALPAFGMQPVREPVCSTACFGASSRDSSQVQRPQDPESSAILEYLKNTRELIRAQHDVMARFLGATPEKAVAPTLDAAAPVIVEKKKEEVQSAPSLNMEQLLLGIIAERTGYPQDMLNMDLDLAADLSIDSIKRIEILSELSQRMGMNQANPSKRDEMVEQLASKKTVRDILNWLSEQKPQTGDASDAVSPAEQEPVEIEGTLLSIVSEKTGYPEDMLDLSLDLAADLSIDSIKRIEILSELSKRVGLATADVSDRDALVETLASKKTLKEILDWITNQQNVSRSPEGCDDQEPPSADGNGATSQIMRYILSLKPAPAVKLNGLPTHDKRFVITDDGHGIAQALSRKLEDMGAITQIIQDEYESTAKLDGLVCFSNRLSMAQLFALTQKALLDGVSWILAVTDFGGNFGLETDPNHKKIHGGMSGLIKTVAKEWPDAKVRVVDIDTQESPEKLSAFLYNELLAYDELVEVGYKDGQRQVLRPVLSSSKMDIELDNLKLSEDSVVLLTGGARGITGRVAVALAERYSPRLVLLGRSALPNPDRLAKEASHIDDINSMRKYLAKLDLGLSLAEIDKKAHQMLGDREISENLEAMRIAGSRVEYHTLDVRDHQAFGDFLDACYHRLGRIDGVIHGAGVVEDKLIRHKSLTSFKRVFDTKMTAATTLAEKLRDDVQFVVFFSSVSGAFGNRGQVDYAAANDAMDKLALSLNRRLRGRVVSINWGPWASTGAASGMVSPELEEEYARQKIGIIPLEEGIKSLLWEINNDSSSDGQVILMCAEPDRFLA